MQFNLRRTALCGLAFSPALAMLVMPDAFKVSLVATLGLPLLAALICAVAIAVTRLASRRPSRSDTPHEAGSLLRSSALRRPAVPVPTPATLRNYLGAVLAAQIPEPDVAKHGQAEPETVDQAVARAMRRILDSWQAVAGGQAAGTKPLKTLSDARLTELYLLDQLLRGAPGLAGALAQQFRNPDILLVLRDQITTIDQRRAAFERQRDAFEATRRAWENQTQKLRPSALLTALQALDWPDSDLWHKVVLAYDPGDPAQREAALWCAQQHSCDRATVARYLASLAMDGQLDAALTRGDHTWLSGARTVIENWNTGKYTRQALALEPPNAVVAAAPHFSDALDRMAGTTGQPRWPDPHGAFAEFHGRASRPRDNWCLDTGQLMAPPALNDYVEDQDRDVA